MNELYDILLDIDDSIDYESEKALIDDRLLTSLHIISLVSELEDHFDISIGPSEMTPDNFNSVEAMYAMIERLK